jgi:hypothetical protein
VFATTLVVSCAATLARPALPRLSTAVAAAQSRTSALPARLDRYLTGQGLSAGDRRRLLEGSAVTRLLDSTGGPDVGAVGAVWIDAPRERYLDRLRDIESFERGRGFIVTKRLSVPPRLDDFAAVHLPVEDVEDLRRCRLERCEVKLDEASLQRFRTEINWGGPDVRGAVDRLMQRTLLDLARGYLEAGHARLPVYRDSARETSVAAELGDLIAGMPDLTNDTAAVRRYLLDFPNGSATGFESFLYWQETEFGLKPLIRLSHIVIREGPDDTLVVGKMLYASHYFWSALETRLLLPDPARGAGFWFVTVNRSRLDGLTGFTRALLRWRVRAGVQDGALNVLRSTKQRLKGAR